MLQESKDNIYVIIIVVHTTPSKQVIQNKPHSFTKRVVTLCSGLRSQKLGRS
jgi:hypothetical protein